MKMDLGHCQLRKNEESGAVTPHTNPNGKGNRQLKFCWCNKKQFIKRARDIRLCLWHVWFFSLEKRLSGQLTRRFSTSFRT